VCAFFSALSFCGAKNGSPDQIRLPASWTGLHDTGMGCCCSAQFWRQFRVLAWKNRLVKQRSWQSLLVELLVPVIIIIALGGVKVRYTTL